MKTLGEHNADKLTFRASMPGPGWYLSGVTCPQCGKELVQEPAFQMTAVPTQAEVRCNCGFLGHKEL